MINWIRTHKNKLSLIMLILQTDILGNATTISKRWVNVN